MGEFSRSYQSMRMQTKRSANESALRIRRVAYQKPQERAAAMPSTTGRSL